MITVYYGRADKLVETIGFDKCLTHIEERRKEKVLRTGDQLSQVRSLATGELLHLAMCRYLSETHNKQEYTLESDSSHKEIKRDLWDKNQQFETMVLPGGKPYFKEYPQIHFNLSHSADYVCCAIGDEPMGVDIQKHVSVRDGLAKRFFTEAENRALESLEAEEREMLFFRMWSIKESFIKYTGEGMKQGLNTFEIDWNHNFVFFKEAIKIQAYFEEFSGIEGYSLSVCRESLETEIAWQSMEELL